MKSGERTESLLIQHGDFNMMTSPVSALCLTFLLMGVTADLKLSSSVHQENRFLSAHVGDNVTLRCVCGDVCTKYSWYKQTLGQNLKLLSNTDHDKVTFHGQFDSNSRFTVEAKSGENNLNISNLRLSDSATYYCTKHDKLKLEFAEGTTLNVEGSGMDVQTLVHQPSSKTIQPGGSVTLNCTVHTGTCNEKHSVYWFKNAEDNQPKIIYAYGGRNNQCGSSPMMQSQMCIYNLTLKSMDVSQTGTYYCAVVSCGYILFGNRTKVDLKRDGDPPILVFCLSGALAVTTVLILFLASSMYKMSKRQSCRRPEDQARSPAPSANDGQGSQDNLHYAALSHNMAGRSRRKIYTSDCVYSTITK